MIGSVCGAMIISAGIRVDEVERFKAVIINPTTGSARLDVMDLSEHDHTERRILVNQMKTVNFPPARSVLNITSQS